MGWYTADDWVKDAVKSVQELLNSNPGDKHKSILPNEITSFPVYLCIHMDTSCEFLSWLEFSTCNPHETHVMYLVRDFEALDRLLDNDWLAYLSEIDLALNLRRIELSFAIEYLPAVKVGTKVDPDQADKHF